MTQVISLELNELNFHYIERDVQQGRLPTFRRLLEKCDLVETYAEKSYPNLEPWIQWPTVYTGLTYDQHRLFRLGDGKEADNVQIWEYLEARGLTVGAISPMNAGNRCRAPAFFLPDPWTGTTTVAEPRAVALFELLAEIVNGNATNSPSLVRTGRELLPLALPFINRRSLLQYARIMQKAVSYNWAKPAVLDRLLADLFLVLVRKNKPGFSSLFLNAGAHIQHHHTYDSESYTGERRNPSWYSKAAADGSDPLLFIYEAYDAILVDMLAVPDSHVFVTTGLSQVPNERDHYQYRPRDYSAFLDLLGLSGAKIEPRMSRDFLLTLPDRAQTERAMAMLGRATVDGKPLVGVEDRVNSLFCQIAYFGPPESLKQVALDGVVHDLSDRLALVSIENAIHQTKGYHIDTAAPKGSGPRSIPLTDLFDRLASACLGVASPELRQAV